MYKNLTVFCLLFLITFNATKAQDVIYTHNSVIKNVKVRDNQPTFIEYRLPDEWDKTNYFITKDKLRAVVRYGGYREDIILDSAGKFHSVYSYTDSIGDTLVQDINYNPTAKFAIDSSIRLCRFKKDNEYERNYFKSPHFYLNDPEKKFFNCKQLTYLGADFSYMMLVNYHDLPKASIIKNKYLSNIAQNINTPEEVKPYRLNFLKGKEMQPDMRAAARSYLSLEPMSWITAQEYSILPGKIPAIIKQMKQDRKEGIGIIFIIEKFSKPEKTVSGYWVAFDFASRQTLLIDYINFGRVEYQVNNFNGWDGFWEAGLISAGAHYPMSFQKYLDLEKKGQTTTELICD